MSRTDDFERMKLRKREYHVRLRRTAEAIAGSNGRAVPNRADIDEAQRRMWQEYLEICRW